MGTTPERRGSSSTDLDPAVEDTLPTGEQQLELEVHRERDAAVITLTGELDPHTAPLLQRELDAALESGCTEVVLDLHTLRFIDSAGLRVIISGHKRLAEIGGSFVVQSPGDTARRLFEITGLDQHLSIRDGAA